MPVPLFIFPHQKIWEFVCFLAFWECTLHCKCSMLSLYIPCLSLGIHKCCNTHHGNQRTSIPCEAKDLSTQVSCLWWWPVPAAQGRFTEKENYRYSIRIHSQSPVICIPEISWTLCSGVLPSLMDFSYLNFNYNFLNFYQFLALTTSCGSVSYLSMNCVKQWLFFFLLNLPSVSFIWWPLVLLLECSLLTFLLHSQFYRPLCYPSFFTVSAPQIQSSFF